MKLKKGSAAAKAYMAKIRAAKGKKTPAKKVGAVKTPIQYKGYTINFIRGNYRAEAYGNPQFSETSLAKVKKQIDSYLNPKKVGYKSDRTNILRTATQYIKSYKDKGYSRKEAIKNANLDAAFSIQGTNKKTAKKVGSTLKLHKKEMRLGITPKTKSKTSNGYHKDTKSHNVNIRVISGVETLINTEKTKKYIQRMQDTIERIQQKYNDYKKRPTYIKDKFDIAEWNKEKRILKYQLAFAKTNLKELRKQLASQLIMLKKLQ